MAMLTINKLIGFFRVFVLKTIISMKVFPAKETENSRKQAFYQVYLLLDCNSSTWIEFHLSLQSFLPKFSRLREQFLFGQFCGSRLNSI